MNREIKFRLWDGKKMAYAGLNSERIAHDLGGHPYLPFYLDSRIDSFSSPVINQFTGLKDKKGKFIYEDDILESPNSKEIKALMKEENFSYWERGIVKYYDELGRFGLEFYSPYGGEGYTGKEQHISDYILAGARVIGNIHQNKELL